MSQHLTHALAAAAVVLSALAAGCAVPDTAATEPSAAATLAESAAPAPATVAESSPPGYLIGADGPDESGEQVQPALPELTTSQQNALESARSYLDNSGFSRSSLVKQLEFEGYPTADAEVAIATIEAEGVDWVAEAGESAASYIDGAGFSRSGLVKQLEFEGHPTPDAEAAVAGLEASGRADWNAEAVESAQGYLDSSSFSRESLITQLTFEGYTEAEATQAADAVGLS